MKIVTIVSIDPEDPPMLPGESGGTPPGGGTPPSPPGG